MNNDIQLVIYKNIHKLKMRETLNIINDKKRLIMNLPRYWLSDYIRHTEYYEKCSECNTSTETTYSKFCDFCIGSESSGYYSSDYNISEYDSDSWIYIKEPKFEENPRFRDNLD